MGKRHHQEAETADDRKERKKKLEKKESKKRLKSSEAVDVPLQQHSASAARSDVFFRKQIELTVSLPPSALRDVRSGIDDCLNSLLLHYSDGVGGIMLAFKDIQLHDDGKGRILDELPYIHYNVTVTTLVFCPMAGSRLKGAITECFHSHLSLVVLHYFNASIPADALQEAGFQFDNTQEQWLNKANTSTILSKGDWIEFECTKVHESGGIISISGARPFLSRNQ